MKIKVFKLSDLYIWAFEIDGEVVTGTYESPRYIMNWTSSHQLGMYHTTEIASQIEEAVEEFIKTE